MPLLKFDLSRLHHESLNRLKIGGSGPEEGPNIMKMLFLKQVQKHGVYKRDSTIFSPINFPILRKLHFLNLCLNLLYQNTLRVLILVRPTV